MTDEAKLEKKIRRILEPYFNIAGRRYGKCELCEAETSWLINNHSVCPVCSLAHGFVTKAYDYGPCEVCGRPGEWICSPKEHALCHRHRDAWFDWKVDRNFMLKDWEKLPKDEKDIAWEKCFGAFIQEAKIAESD